MKKSVLILMAALLFAFPGRSQNDSDWESKTYHIGSFSRVFLKGSFRVFLLQEASCGLTVKTTDEDVFDDLIVEDAGNELRIEMDREWYNYDRINLYISFPDLEKLKIEGGANVKTNGYLDLNHVFLHVEGGAKIDLKLKAEEVRVVGEGGVLFELNGVTDRLEVSISGAGHVDARELKARDVVFRIEGFGTGSVHAVKNLDVTINGVGKVRYKGDPKVSQYIDGLGSVKRD